MPEILEGFAASICRVKSVGLEGGHTAQGV